jgi:hypothetical protein
MDRRGVDGAPVPITIVKVSQRSALLVAARLMQVHVPWPGFAWPERTRAAARLHGPGEGFQFIYLPICGPPALRYQCARLPAWQLP